MHGGGAHRCYSLPWMLVRHLSWPRVSRRSPPRVLPSLPDSGGHPTSRPAHLREPNLAHGSDHMYGGGAHRCYSLAWMLVRHLSWPRVSRRSMHRVLPSLPDSGLCGRRWSRTSIPSRRASSTHPIVLTGATLVYLEGGFDILRRGVMHWPPPHHRCSPALRIWASDHHRGIAPACVGQFNRFKARHPLILPSPIAS